jgi:hypothetical protein
MNIVIRALVGIAGVLALVVALAFWFNPAAPAARLGIAAQEALGFATLRADMGGFFAGAGALSLAAAIRNNARLLTAPLILIALALTGRALTVVLSGYAPSMLQPMLIEAALLALLVAGRRTFAQG